MFLFPLHWKPLNFIRSNRSLVLLRTVLDTCTPTKRSLCPISLSVWRFLPMCTWGYFTHKSNEKWEIGVGKNNSLIDRGILCLLLHQEKVYVDIIEIKKKKKEQILFCRFKKFNTLEYHFAQPLRFELLSGPEKTLRDACKLCSTCTLWS